MGAIDPVNVTEESREITGADGVSEMEVDTRNVAVSGCARFIVIEIGFDEPALDPSRVQPLNTKPLPAVAEMLAEVPESYQYDPTAGLVEPPLSGLTDIVSWY